MIIEFLTKKEKLLKEDVLILAPLKSLFIHKMKYFFLFLFLFTFSASYSQDSTAVLKSTKPAKKHYKGRIYFYWGWNRSIYTQSNIQFTGDNYNFTLSDVIANDRQTPFNVDPYLNPALITIPQTNMRFGYFVSDNWEVSIGVDHMKYVMQQDQVVKINGYIDEDGNEYSGIYENEDIELSEEFLTFEHTDGLNYINIELNRFQNLVQFNQISKVNIDINALGGLGIGMMYPKSNVMLFGKNRNDAFHVAGFGLSAKIGLNVSIYDYFFIQSELKGGYINMADILTSTYSEDRAKQDFFFLQVNILFGVAIPLIKHEKE